MKLLRLVLNITETSGAYYLFTLPMSKFIKQDLISVYPPDIGINSNLRLFHSSGSMINYVKILSNVLKKEKYDIIHAHTPHVAIALILSIFFRVNNVKKRIPKLFSVHYSYNHLRLRNRILLLPIFLFFDRVVFCSEASFYSFPTIYRKTIRNKFNVIYNGVDIKKVNLKEKELQRKGEGNIFKIVVVSRLEGFKNIDIVIKSIPKLNDKNIALTIIGDGTARSFLELEVNKRSLNGRVFFLGSIDRHLVYEELLKSDLYISSSSTEGLPVSVLEAMASGCPVILSDINPHVEIALKDTSSIYLSKLGSIDSLVKNIQSILKMKIEDRIKLGLSCRKVVEDNYNSNSMVRHYIDNYNQL